MTTKTAEVKCRLDEKLKNDVTDILTKEGRTASDVIRFVFELIQSEGKFNVDRLRIPKKATDWRMYMDPKWLDKR